GAKRRCASQLVTVHLQLELGFDLGAIRHGEGPFPSAIDGGPGRRGGLVRIGFLGGQSRERDVQNGEAEKVGVAIFHRIPRQVLSGAPLGATGTVNFREIFSSFFMLRPLKETMISWPLSVTVTSPKQPSPFLTL